MLINRGKRQKREQQSFELVLISSWNREIGAARCVLFEDMVNVCRHIKLIFSPSGKFNSSSAHQTNLKINHFLLTDNHIDLCLSVGLRRRTDDDYLWRKRVFKFFRTCVNICLLMNIGHDLFLMYTSNQCVRVRLFRLTGRHYWRKTKRKISRQVGVPWFSTSLTIRDSPQIRCR